MIKRVLSVVLCLFLLMVTLSACSGKKFTAAQTPFDTEIAANNPAEDTIIAQNSKYTLEYDAETASVRLVDTAGTAWDICPEYEGEPIYDDFGLEVTQSGFSLSAIEVGYMDKQINGGGNMVASSYDSVLDGMGRLVFKEIENGVTIEYYFDSQKFMIPVNYVLKDDYLSISIDTTKIQEEELKITYVSLAPFLSSVENDAENSYLFYPSGSGALLSTNSINEQGISYSAYVYGDDLTMEEEYIATNQTSIRMPVYGYKNGDVGGVAIIDQGADTALLNSVVGNTNNFFSTVYPSFQLRGYTAHKATSFSNTYTTNIFPNHMIEGTVSIRFYPLSGEAADYNGMANVYRDYLIDEYGLTEVGEEKALSVDLLGGTMITKSFLGIPYETLYATTTVNEANNIVTDLSELVDDLVVKLKGFGTSGVDISKIGGGYKIGGNIGSGSQIKTLSQLCLDNKIDLYMDYDVVKFSKSGSGFSNFSDVVMNSGYIRSDQFVVDRALRNNEEKYSYRLLRPTQFSKAVSKAINKNNDWKVSGVSFDTLSSLSYSDYSDYNSTVAYNSKHGFGDAVAEALAQIKENNQKYLANNANAYAAVYADIITNVPTSSDNGHTFFEDVPFYSMVFKGYIPMTGESVNLSANTKTAVLGAVESGIGLNYTLISKWSNKLLDAMYPNFYSTVYSGVKDDMLSTYDKLASYYESIDGAKISSSTIISKGVHCTTFDNGVTVYVNYNSSSAQTPAGEVGAYDYIILGGAA